MKEGRGIYDRNPQYLNENTQSLRGLCVTKKSDPGCETWA